MRFSAGQLSPALISPDLDANARIVKSGLFEETI